MQETFYALGFTIVRAIPIVIAMVCVWRIARNLAIIKEYEKKNGKIDTDKK